MLNRLNKSLGIWVILLIVILLVSNFILQTLDIKVDATVDRSYSLAPNTKKYISSLDKKVVITLYYSKSHPLVPYPVKNFGNRVVSTLQEIANNSKGNITLNIIDPKPDSDDEQLAAESGISPMPVNGLNYFLGATFSSGAKDLAIGSFDQNRERYIEYDVASKIYELTVEKKQKLGILSAVKLPGLSLEAILNTRAPIFIQELNRVYDVKTLPYKLVAIPDDIDMLLVLHPKDISSYSEYAIDQFLMRGGNIIVAFDPFFRNDPDAIVTGRPTLSVSKLPTLFPKWGINYHDGEVLANRELATIVNTQNGPAPYPMWLSFKSFGIEKNQAVTANINQLDFQEPGAIFYDEKSGDKDWKFDYLVFSPEKNAFANGLLVRFTDPIHVAAGLTYQFGYWGLVGVLTLKANSAFTAKPTLKPEDKKDTSLAEAIQKLPEQKKSMDKSGRIAIFSDFDFLVDNVATNQVSAFGQNVTQLRNDNLNLFFSLLADLQNNPLLSLIKPKAIVSRPFTKLEAMQVAAQEKYQTSEKELDNKLMDLQASLRGLRPPNDGTGVQLPAATLEKIKQYQVQEADTKKALRDTRKLLREDIESLITVLTLINILLVPLLMALAGVLVYRKRSQNAK